MQEETGHSHEEEDGHVHENEEDAHSVYEIDEHVWTDPENASAITGEIRDILMEKDPSNREIYEENTRSYQEKLSELDREFHEVVDSAERNLVIFGDRFHSGILRTHMVWITMRLSRGALLTQNRALPQWHF